MRARSVQTKLRNKLHIRNLNQASRHFPFKGCPSRKRREAKPPSFGPSILFLMTFNPFHIHPQSHTSSRLLSLSFAPLIPIHHPHPNTITPPPVPHAHPSIIPVFQTTHQEGNPPTYRQHSSHHSQERRQNHPQTAKKRARHRKKDREHRQRTGERQKEHRERLEDGSGERERHRTDDAIK